MNKYENLELWESASNYMGEDYSDQYQVKARTRDSDILEQANFIACEEYLKKLGIKYENNSFGHWACGWAECLMVPADSDPALLQQLDTFLGLDGCYIYDEDLYYEMLRDYANEYYNDNIKDDEDLKEEVLSRLSSKYSCEASDFNNEDVDLVLRVLYDEACCNYGEEDAFLDDDNIDKLFSESDYQLGEVLGIDTDTHQGKLF